MDEDQIKRWKDEMEKMLHEAKAFKDCSSRWRHGYADGIEDALFKPGARVAPELIDQVHLTLAGMKRARATGVYLDPIDPNKVERGERLMILHVLYEKHYPYPKVYGYVAGEFEIVAMGTRYVTMWPTDAKSLTGVVDREKGFRPGMLKVDSRAYNTFVIR